MNDGNGGSMYTGDALRSTRRDVLIAGGGVAMAGLAGCLSGDSEAGGIGGGEGSNDEISAVAGSFFMLYDLAINVAGETLDVEDLVPTGAHGDDWEPDPGVIEDVASADVFVYIDGFRAWSDDIAASLPEDYPDVVVVDAAEGIEYIEGEDGRDDDPHFWMDPPKAIQAVENIRDGFVDADPNNAETYEENADAFIAEIEDVHDRFEETMENRTKNLIVIGSHDSFQYWTRRYGIEIYSPVGISPDAEPTPEEMERVDDLVTEHGLDYVLYDKYEPTDLADALAEETGTETLPLSPIEATTEEQLDQGMGWVEHMLEINLETLRKALAVEGE